MKKLTLSTLLASITLALSAPSAFAISTLPTSGTCGFAINGSFPFIGVQLTGLPAPGISNNGAITTYYPSPSANGTLNWLGTINFGTKIITVNLVSQTATNANTGGFSQGRFVNTQEQVSIAFTVGDPSAGMYTLDLGESSINVIPVNGGNTILMQQFQTNNPGGKTGVCQF
jgi:hypothetical protein